MTRVSLEEKVLQANDNIAQNLRNMFTNNQVKAINLISSPGAGKTTLLEQSIEQLANQYGIGVIEGDVLTTRDAERIAKLNVPVVQIETKGTCHLDAQMIAKAISQIPIDKIDLLMIENVGNLVCPSSFDLGENAKVVVLSIAEGSDKPAKYPQIFTKATACVLNKIDLLPYSNFDIEAFYQDIKRINPKLKVFELSATKGIGIESWLNWLKGMISNGGQEN